MLDQLFFLRDFYGISLFHYKRWHVLFKEVRDAHVGDVAVVGAVVVVDDHDGRGAEEEGLPGAEAVLAIA